MPEYRFQAVGTNGSNNNGILTAATEQEAMAMLDAKGLYPLRIELAQQRSQQMMLGFRKVSARQMATFYSQLADLLHAGVPLLRCIDILERQATSNMLGQILREVRARVADGTTLADAMAPHPKAFTELAVSMIRAGQEGGFLEEVLKRIAHFTDHQEDLKAKVVGALAYPVFLAVFGTAILIVLVIFFVPMFEPIFERLRQRNEMPVLTVWLIGFSNVMIHWWPLLLVLVVGAIAAFIWWKRTADGRLTLDTLKLRTPGAGKIYLHLALARFTRIQGTLLQNGIPLLQALRVAKDSTGNRVLTLAIEQAAENVTEGNSLAKPLEACRYIPRDVVEMVAVGEESNNLEKVLLDIADALEKRTARQLELFVRLLEPIMLLVMAAFTLVIVAGLLLPVFKMSSSVQ
jgi:general secretion pathway protein F/type IV pilus assembly protein PilC